MDTITNNSGASGAPARAARAKKSPRFFLLKAFLLYYIGVSGQFLTMPAVLERYGLWPFMVMQIVLAAFWYWPHAARLRDAGRGAASAQGVLAVYALAVALLFLIGIFFMDEIADVVDTPQSVMVIRQIVTFSRGAGDPLTYIGLIACAALLLPPAYSIWVGRLGKSA